MISVSRLKVHYFSNIKWKSSPLTNHGNSTKNKIEASNIKITSFEPKENRCCINQGHWHEGFSFIWLYLHNTWTIGKRILWISVLILSYILSLVSISYVHFRQSIYFFKCHCLVESMFLLFPKFLVFLFGIFSWLNYMVCNICFYLLAFWWFTIVYNHWDSFFLVNINLFLWNSFLQFFQMFLFTLSCLIVLVQINNRINITLFRLYKFHLNRHFVFLVQHH